MVPQVPMCVQIFLPKEGISLSELVENYNTFAFQVVLPVYEYSCEEGCC